MPTTASRHVAPAATPRDDRRYAASVRLSVAPMMDWTDIAENLFSINKLDPLLRVALHLRCPEVTYGLS